MGEWLGFVLLVGVASICGVESGRREGGPLIFHGPLKLKQDEIISLESTATRMEGVYNPEYWTEKNERSTSKEYTLWEEADVHFVEWPGNVTVRDPEWPLLKWGQSRAKFVVNRCCESFVGIEMRVYAYRYVFLTWGYHRFLKTVTPPLTMPAKLLNERERSKNRTEVTVSDFVFVHDALLVVVEGIVVSVGGLELAYAPDERAKGSGKKLKYSVAKGISSPVNKLVSQYCCEKTDKGAFCPWGETVVAYREYSSDFSIFISKDGGGNFRLLVVSGVPSTSKFLHAVLSYPDLGKVLLFHGTKDRGSLDAYSMLTGAVLGGGGEGPYFSGTRITGLVQARRIGDGMSLVLWDKCNVWYSRGEGRNMTKAVFYVHGFIRNGGKKLKVGKKKQKHFIMEKWCKFGKESRLTVANGGKVAILDAENTFHLGVDTKSEIFQLVATKVDMSLIPEKEQGSIAPHFDHSDHPKLMYPPRYLELPDAHKAFVGQGNQYEERLAVRLLPKTVFPSEFITVFFPENVHSLPKKFKKFALPVCQTSSISVNRSISQKPKYYRIQAWEEVRLRMTFKRTRQNDKKEEDDEMIRLRWEGASDLDKFLRVRIRPLKEEEGGDENKTNWTGYEVVIKPRSLSRSRHIFKLNFYTWRSLRCNVQPGVAVYVKIEDGGKGAEEEDDDEIRSYLRTDKNHITIGKRWEKPKEEETCSGGGHGGGGGDGAGCGGGDDRNNMGMMNSQELYAAMRAGMGGGGGMLQKMEL